MIIIIFSFFLFTNCGRTQARTAATEKKTKELARNYCGMIEELNENQNSSIRVKCVNLFKRID